MRNKTPGLLAISLLLVASEARAYAPAFNILGSYFPAWMACVLASLALAVLLHLIVRRAGLQQYFEPTVITYPSLTAFFSFSLWLALFS